MKDWQIFLLIAFGITALATTFSYGFGGEVLVGTCIIGLPVLAIYRLIKKGRKHEKAQPV